MTSFELRAARRKLGLKKTEMAFSLQTPYPTYRDWESGERRIPGVCAVAVRFMLEKDAAFMSRFSPS